jgi:4-carboxymuconolactone decarboxylase
MANDDTKQNRGGRLPLLAPADMNDAQKAVYAKLGSAVRWAERSGFAAQTENGELLGPFNAFLRSPDIAVPQLEYQRAEAKSTSLSPALREVVILTVGSVWKAAYELYAHRAVARTVKIADADIERLCAGEAPTEMGTEAALLQRFVHAFAKEHRVADALYGEAVAAFGEKGIVDILHLAGIYMLVSAMLNVFEVPAPAT